MYTRTVTIPDPHLIEELEAPEGYRAFLMHDGDADSPRGYGNDVATIINENSRLIEIDKDEAGLREARDYFDHGAGGFRERMMKRYVAMFRPDVTLYVDHWSAGRENYGWGYVLADDTTEGERHQPDQDAFDQEVETYRQWAEGEVYGVIVTHEESGREASLWGIYDDTGHYVEQVVSELVEEVSA